jgi:hypothetical protein
VNAGITDGVTVNVCGEVILDGHHVHVPHRPVLLSATVPCTKAAPLFSADGVRL